MTPASSRHASRHASGERPPAPIGALARRLTGVLLAVACAAGGAQTAPADALRAQFAALHGRPGANLFDRPVYLTSTEGDSASHGDVYALVEHPYAQLQHTLVRPDHWCGILILHLNVQYCRAHEAGDRATLDVGIGRKFDQPLADLYRVAFAFRVAAAGDDRLDVTLQSPSGPLSTRDFHLELEAVPYEGKRSLVHLSYGYAYGTAARWAVQAYLATLGRGKVGFSVVGHDAAGRPERVGGMQGVLERNTVRYHLAIEAYLDAHDLPADEQVQASLAGWFDATERYPEQLHELERADYLRMKRSEIKRQEAPPAKP